jgi:hypothetical protein
MAGESANCDSEDGVSCGNGVNCRDDSDVEMSSESVGVGLLVEGR